MRSDKRAALQPGGHHGWDHQETDPEAPLQRSLLAVVEIGVL